MAHFRGLYVLLFGTWYKCGNVSIQYIIDGLAQEIGFCDRIILIFIILMQRMLLGEQPRFRFAKVPDQTFTLTDGFFQKPVIMRKSLNGMPFRKPDSRKANTTQTYSRKTSLRRQSQKQRNNGEELPNITKEQKCTIDKANYFDQFLSDGELLRDYKLMSHIGKGCFSTVTLALHKESSRPFAIKIYEKIDAMEVHRLDSIKREIKHLKKLQHDNVIHLFHVFRDKKKILLLMDNGGKQSLSGLLRKFRAFTEDKAKAYFRQIMKAISYCHSKGICHRDIKPENILVDDEGFVKVIDFGFSASTQIKLTTFCGTPPFMCPQITKKIPYNGAGADIWALGVMLYQLIIGTLPFRATNQQQLYRLIQQEHVKKLEINFKQDVKL